jgi:hypothetical protein
MHKYPQGKEELTEKQLSFKNLGFLMPDVEEEKAINSAVAWE